MYYAVILLLMLVLPAGSVAVEHFGVHRPDSLVALTGKWFVLWAGGARLGLAAVRQIVKPAYTAKTIFATDDKAAQHVVRELGFGNLALAVISLVSLVAADWRLPAATACAVFYLLAGVRHAIHAGRTAQQDWAMVSDLFAGLVLGGYVAASFITTA